MVNFRVVSEYSDNPPTELGRLKIVGGPLYDLARIQTLVEDETQLLAWTPKCRKDVHKFFSGDLAEVADLLQLLSTRDYRDSEWCEDGKGSIAACDAYTVRRMEEVTATGTRAMCTYFLKFAIAKSGVLVLVVSCHI
jgi:hypothetical protein